MPSEQSVLIALGGNALILPDERGYIDEQFRHADACMKPIAALIHQGVKMVITHGNGPIVGNILLRNECARDYIPPMPLYICVADSQGGIGAMMTESLQNELAKIGLDKTISVLVTHVVVEKDDPAFLEPTKPIGPYYSDEQARVYMTQGWRMRKIQERGWRRLVPSPRPKKILEKEAIRIVFENGVVPIACGGGGIPVIEDAGTFKGVDAVIDKDLSASLLARELGIERFVILTDVNGVYLDWGTDERKKLESLTAKDVRTYLLNGQFPSGSMGPKIEAALQFIDAGGREVIIARPEDLERAMRGVAGTTITP
ncbi:MAG TPA: carbamate kinase [Thermodesulfovibrionales bacterium]|nr:carbamate kinase [Thermodesulfovibrionales bacterium]